MLQTLLASIFFYLFPLLIGAGVSRAVKLRRRLVTVWLCGTVFLVSIFALANSLSAYAHIPIALSMAGLKVAILLAALGGLISLLPRLANVSFRATFAAIKEYVLVAFGIGIVGMFIWRSNSPYPDPLNWDIYEHLTLSNQLLQGHFNLLLKSYSDTFLVNTYLPFFHIILTAPRMFFSPNVLGYYWWLEILHYAIIVGISGWLAWVLTGRRLVTVVAMVIAGFTFESFIAYTSLFLLPQTLTAVIFIACLVELLRGYRSHSLPQVYEVVMWSIFLVLSHFFVGTFSALLFIGFYILLRADFKTVLDQSWKWTVPLCVAILIGVIGLNNWISWNPFNTDESRFFNLSLMQKFVLLTQWYGYAFFILTPIGAYAVYKRSSYALRIFAVICLALLSALAFPFPYNIKLFVIARFFFQTMLAIGLAWLIDLISQRLLRLIALGIWTGVFMSIFMLNQQYAFKQYIEYRGSYTHVTTNERLAGDFLRQSFPDPTAGFIISEPATQYILEAYTGINSQGGAYMTAETRTTLDFVFPNPDTVQIAEALKLIHDEVTSVEEANRLFIVSGRFFDWQAASKEEQQAIFFNIWRPRDFHQSELGYMTMLKNSPEFELLYQNPGVAIFRIK